MSMDDDADDDIVGRGPPLPPDDRLWRHPSELSTWGRGGAARLSSSSAGVAGRDPTWPIALIAGFVGAALCGGILAVTGTLTTGGRQRVVEKVAMTPVVSFPMVPGERGIAALAEQAGPTVARLVVTTADGTAPASGVVYRDDGLLLTSAREVAGATAISVVLHDGRRFEGELIGADLPTDVAVVSIDVDHLTVAVMGTAQDLTVGTLAIAIGSAGESGADPSITTGVVSALERRLDIDGESLHGMIQTDAPIEAGWSGGPLVDASGAVIGITTDIAGPGTGFGFATPIDLVRVMADELVAWGKVAHGWLGIEGSDLPVEQARAIGVPGGATVRRVAAGSPAELAGLAPHDVITDVDGDRVSSSSGLVVAVRRHKPGEKVVVGYWRAGHRHKTTVTIEERP